MNNQIKNIKQDDFENNISVAQNAIDRINIFINKYNDSTYLRELEKCKLSWKTFLNNQREYLFNFKREINNKIINSILESLKDNDKYKDMDVWYFDRKKRDEFIENNNLIIKDEYMLVLLSKSKKSIEINVKVITKVIGNNVIINNLEVVGG